MGLVESNDLECELDRDGKFGKEGLAFDDVLLLPAESSVLPNDVATASRLTRTIALEIPIVSSAMDTVTEARLAIALAREGGIGVLHRNLSIPDQVSEVDKVKRSEAGMIVEPVTLGPDDLVADALELMARYRVIAPQLEPVSLLGAGDALLAQYLAAVLDDRPADDALRIAVGAGRFEPREAVRLAGLVELHELEPVS